MLVNGILYLTSGGLQTGACVGLMHSGLDAHAFPFPHFGGGTVFGAGFSFFTLSKKFRKFMISETSLGETVVWYLG